MVSSQALQEGTGQLSGRQRLLFTVGAQRVGRWAHGTSSQVDVSLQC